MNASFAPQQRNENLVFPFASASIVCLFLFYIDEGYYDFRWMSDPGNWIAFIFYTGAMFSFQVLAQHYLFRNIPGLKRDLLSFFVGIPLGIAVVIGFIFALRALA